MGAIAVDFGFARWEDLMPYATGAFVLFGLGSVPAGRLGDHWGRRAMMLVFLFGIGVSCLLAAMTQNAWQLAAALTLMGAFASIYHPVGIPMLVQHTTRPGAVIGVNGLVGNLGIAVGRGADRISRQVFRLAHGVRGAGHRLDRASASCSGASCRRSMRRRRSARRSNRTCRAASSSRAVLILTHHVDLRQPRVQLHDQRQRRAHGATACAPSPRDPAVIGALLGLVYVVASFSQLFVGRAIDRYPLKRLFLFIVLAQIPLFVLAMLRAGLGVLRRWRSRSWRSCSARFRSPMR